MPTAGAWSRRVRAWRAGGAAGCAARSGRPASGAHSRLLVPQDQKSRLALALVNCHQAAHGGETFPCSRRTALKACLAALPDRMWTLYVEFLTHADAMCLYIQNQQVRGEGRKEVLEPRSSRAG